MTRVVTKTFPPGTARPYPGATLSAAPAHLVSVRAAVQRRHGQLRGVEASGGAAVLRAARRLLPPRPPAPPAREGKSLVLGYRELCH